MEMLVKFVSEHLNDDTSRLILDKSKWPEIDMELAVNCIESRRKLKGKVSEWCMIPELIFPSSLSAEQCSSSATGRYKTALAGRVAACCGKKEGTWKIADLTGGLGVDSWFFSQKAAAVLYNEMQERLCRAAGHNFRILGADGISISNHCAEEGRIGDILGDFAPDIIYMDPARRGEGGKKVFLIEDCTPDILKLQDELFRHVGHLIVKLSPMADVTMVCERLGKHCREVHVIASGGECKELLIWMDRNWEGGYMIIPAEISGEETYTAFTFNAAQEKDASPVIFNGRHPSELQGRAFLFEPGKALMKAGAFNLVCRRFGISKLGVSTHYYIVEDIATAAELSDFGKIYRINMVAGLDKRSIKAAAAACPKADVTARNIPMDTAALQKKLGVRSGDGAHIFGLRSDVFGNLLLCTERVFKQDLQSHSDQNQSSDELGL